MTMNKAQLIALYDQDQRVDIEFPDMRREATQDVVRHRDTSNRGEGVITYSRLNETNAEEVIREQLRYFESIGQDFEWKVYDYDKPADLKQRLAGNGFIIEQAEAIMVLDLKNAPTELWHPVSHDVRQIYKPEELLAVQAIEQQVWNEDSTWVHDMLGDALTNYPQQMSVYIASVDGQPASAAWIYFPKHSSFASLWGGATIADFRGQGLYTALLGVRAQEAKARGVRYLTTDASSMSRPILEKFGFEMLAWSYPCKWEHKSQ